MELLYSLSKYKELKIEVSNFDDMPEFVALFFNMWKQYMMMINNQENKLLIELRDTLLPILINGQKRTCEVEI